MKAIVTICSKEKNQDSELLPAAERYLGTHVAFAKDVADKTNTPLYILSGKYGLISGDDFIPAYDYLLEKDSDALTSLVASQATEAGITEIEYYSKDKSEWLPYTDTLRKACTFSGITLRNNKL